MVNGNMIMKGDRFGRLIAMQPGEGRYRWRFLCDCSNMVEKDIYSVKNGKTSSCGCATVELRRNKIERHGHARNGRVTLSYGAYVRLIRSGDNITDRWKSDFSQFLQDMGECPPKHSVVRKNENLEHGPDNSVYVSASYARTNAILVEYQGRIATLKNVARAEDVDYSRLHLRVQAGIALDEAISEARLSKPKPLITVWYNGEAMNLRAFANLVGVNYAKLLYRTRRYNMDPVETAKALLEEGEGAPRSQRAKGKRKSPRPRTPEDPTQTAAEPPKPNNDDEADSSR